METFSGSGTKPVRIAGQFASDGKPRGRIYRFDSRVRNFEGLIGVSGNLRPIA